MCIIGDRTFVIICFDRVILSPVKAYTGGFYYAD